MIELIPPYNELVGEAKHELKRFVGKCKSLNEEQKQALIDEIGNNYFDDRFDFKFAKSSIIQMQINEFNEMKFELAEFWKNVVLASASKQENPVETANKACEEFKQKFLLRNEDKK